MQKQTRHTSYPFTVSPIRFQKDHINLKSGKSPVTKDEAMSQNPGRIYTNHIVPWDAFRTFLDFKPFVLSP